MKHSLRTRVRFPSYSVQLILMLLALCAGLFPASSAWAANASFVWAMSIGGTLNDWGNDIKTDAAGNVYTTGYFQGTVDFDPGAGTFNLTSAGGPDIFVTKLDSSGNFVWARGMGGIDNDQGYTIALDNSGNVYISGIFSSTADFDPGPGTFDLNSAGNTDIFISKLDSNGDFIWVKSMGGVGFDSSRSLAVDLSGNMYSTGNFEGTVDLDPGVGTVILNSGGSSDSFVSKFDSNGNLVWVRGMGGVGFDQSYSLALDTSGNIYSTGRFENTVDFDPGPGTASLTSAGDLDIFVLKLDNSGNFGWAKSMGGIDTDQSFSLAVNSSGHIYTTGRFGDAADFDPGPGTVILPNAGDYDIFISKLDNNGNFLWARNIGGPNPEHSLDLALDASGNVYTTGYFRDTLDFDPGGGIANLTGAGSSDIFILKLDSNGAYVRAYRMGGTQGDDPGAIAVDSGGSIYTTGEFAGTADFDPGPGTANLTSIAGYDIFISKLQQAIVFTDVPAGYWALDFIERLHMAGITGGCATNPLRYCPEETVTRAQMAVFLLKGIHGASYSPPAVGSTTGFGDVPTDYWAAAFVKQLAAEGITSGCGSGNYCPEQPVTRAQMAVFLLRAKYGASYTPPAVGSSTGFGDVPPDYWAAAFIKQLVAEGITVGCGSGNYCPEQPVTRSQMAVFLVRTFSLP